MQPTTPDAPSPKHPFTKTTFWRIVRWIPATITLVTALTLLTMLLQGGMAKITAWYLLQIFPPLAGLLSFIVILLYAILRRRLSKPVVISGVIALLAMTPALLMVIPVAYPASLAATTPVATVRLPADVPLKVVWGGDRLETNYHAAAPDQRWAYDLVVEPYFSGSAKLSDYGCYGVPIFAPAAGKVVKARDGEPDETPGVFSNNTTAPEGNFVAIELDSKTYLLIAHLKSGSVRVKTGDIVEEGQSIGECGNSGNTSEPHIHIHHQRQDPNLYPLNFAEGLPLYFRDHNGPPMPLGGVKVEGDKATATGDTVQHIGK